MSIERAQKDRQENINQDHSLRSSLFIKTKRKFFELIVRKERMNSVKVTRLKVKADLSQGC